MKVGSKALAVGLVGIAAAGAWGSGCSAKKPTELVPGVFTQVQVPRDLAQIRVDVRSNGVQKFCQSYDVTNGTVLLPATLGVVSATSPQTVVTVEVRGYDAPGVGGSDMTNCTDAKVDDPTMGGPRILRRSIQSFVDQHTLFLPMPLSYSCFDQDCPSPDSSQTCKGAQCVDGHVDPSTLVDFDPALVDGTQDCFPADKCFTYSAPAVAIDANNCVYGLAQQMPIPGLNVRVFYQDYDWVQDMTTGQYEARLKSTSEQEILSADSTEGFSVLPNQQFQLAPGLCKLAKANVTPPAPPTMGTGSFRTISSIVVAGGCPPKSPLLPICPPDRLTASATSDGGKTTDVTCKVPVPLVAAPSAVYLVMDDSDEMKGAFGPTGYATAMGLSLASPVFKRTYVAFQFLKHVATDCTGGMNAAATPDLDFALALAAQPSIATRLLGWTMPPAGAPQDLYLEAAMLPGGAYKRVSQFATGLGEALNVGAVMFFLNRTPLSFGGTGGSDGGTGLDAGGGGMDAGVAQYQSVDCPATLTQSTDPTTAAQQAIQAAVTAAASATPPMTTYFVVLDNAQHTPPLAFFQGIAGATTLNATLANPQQVLVSFAQTASAIGTCLYELPPGVDTSAQLKYTNPYGPVDMPIPYAAACNASAPATVDGWNIEGAKRIRVCGQSCQLIRQTVLGVTAEALMADASTVPEVPVTATMPCITTH
jgi:hypothetical protein